MKPILPAILIAAGLALGLSGAAAAKSTDEGTPHANGTHDARSASSRGDSQVASRIADAFAEFAGSPENAESLVTGLRSGSEITLAGAGGAGTGGRDAAGKPGTTTFTSPAGPMGYGEAYITLALAKDQLASYGIDNPTPQQIAAVLNGGTVSAGELGDMQLQGVLQMRADGMGWGRIAQAQGTKLGWVVSGLRSNGSHAGSIVSTSFGTSAGADTGTTDGGRAAAGKATTTGITNATGEHAAGSNASGAETGKGVVNAGGGTHGKSMTAHSDPGRGIHNALGANAASGNAYAYGKTKSHGVITATGASAGATLAGAGIVNAGGGGHGHSAAAAGIVNGSGGGYGQTAAVTTAAAASASSQGGGAGIVSANGGGHGHGNANGYRHGHGYGHWQGRGK